MPRFDRKSLFGNLKDDAVCAVGEFVGTFTFLTLAYGGIQTAAYEAAANGAVAGGVPDPAHAFYIACSMGFGLLVAVWLFAKATGANLNPNISFALLLLGKLGPVRFVLYCIAQFIGAIAAAGLVHGLIPGEFASRCSLSPGVSKVQGVFIEAFITAALVSSVLFLAVETRSLTDLAPVGIGLTLFAGHLVAAALTGAGTNTARAFAPDVIAGFNTEQWIYWIGPTIGAVVAAAFYKLFTSARYPALRSNEGQPLIAPVLPKGTDRESSPEISHPGKAEEV